jgi:hypothetical protein
MGKLSASWQKALARQYLQVQLFRNPVLCAIAGAGAGNTGALGTRLCESSSAAELSAALGQLQALGRCAAWRRAREPSSSSSIRRGSTGSSRAITTA